MSAGIIQSKKLSKSMQENTQKCKFASDLIRCTIILSIPDLRALRASDYILYVYIYVHIYYTNAICPPRISKWTEHLWQYHGCQYGTWDWKRMNLKLHLISVF